MQQRVEDEASSHGVKVIRGTRVEGLARAEERGIIVEIEGRDPLTVDLVVAATGVRPNSELAAEAGLALGAARSIKVDERRQSEARTAGGDPELRILEDDSDCASGWA